MKDSEQARGTHVLSSIKGETRQESEKSPASDGYSLSVEYRDEDKSE